MIARHAGYSRAVCRTHTASGPQRCMHRSSAPHLARLASSLACSCACSLSLHVYLQAACTMHGPEHSETLALVHCAGRRGHRTMSRFPRPRPWQQRHRRWLCACCGHCKHMHAVVLGSGAQHQEGKRLQKRTAARSTAPMKELQHPCCCVAAQLNLQRFTAMAPAMPCTLMHYES